MSQPCPAEIILVGAGMAGLTAASRLREAGHAVRVLEKSRGPGGRMSTRRAGPWQFDHGAQYFTARDPGFRQAVEQWQARGLVGPWNPRIRVFGPSPEKRGDGPATRWVGVPGMNGILRDLAGTVDCRYEHRVTGLSRHNGGWRLTIDGRESMECNRIVLTPPPAQTAQLLGQDHPLHATVSRVHMQPCLALMLAFDNPLDPGFDAAFVNTGPLSWLARNGSRPGREGETWVVHGTPEWSRANLEQSPESLIGPMTEAFEALLGRSLPHPAYVTAHRWRYALADPGLEVGCLDDPETGLVIAGDWCAGNRVEGAWKSGVQAAQACLVAP